MEDKKPVSLDELMAGSKTRPNAKGNARSPKEKQIKEVDMSAFVKVKPHISPADKAKLDLFDQVDQNIERVKKDLTENVIGPFREACIAASLEDEADKAGGDVELEKQLEAVGDHNVLSRKNDDDLATLLADDEGEDTVTPYEPDDAEMAPSTMDDEPEEDDHEEEKQEEEPEMAEDKPDTFMEDPDEVVEKKQPKTKKAKAEKKKEPEEKMEPVVPTKREDPVKVPTEVTSVMGKTQSNHQETISDDDLKDFLEEETSEMTEDEKEDLKARQKEFRDEVYEKLEIEPHAKSNFKNGFKISKKPVSINRVLETTAAKLHTATWPLPNSGRLITFSALSGEEIENLNPESHDENMSADMNNRLIFGTIFSHLVDPNKPETMEEWLKTINWFDINDLYFAIYRATFGNSNFVTYPCPKDKCKKISLMDVKLSDMIKYADEDAEKLYKKLSTSGVDATPESISEDVVPVSDKFAIGFRAPSVFDIVFGASSLDPAFRAKYATTIGNISYMSNVYFIKGDTLFPIDCKPAKNNPAKTMRNKIVAYYNVLKTMGSDKFSMVTNSISEINTKNKNMATFHYPDAVCPKCGAKIERANEELNPLIMLFLRHQLVQLANSTIE